MYAVLTKYVPPFCTSPNCSTDSYTVLNRPRSRGATQRARGVRHSLILGRGSARLEATEDNATGRTRAVSARCVLGHVDSQIAPSSREYGPRIARAITQRNREARIRALARAGAMTVRHSHVVEV